MLQETSISERRACALLGLARDSWRHPSGRAKADRDMSQRITQLAHERRRSGYRRIADLIRADGTAINATRSGAWTSSATAWPTDAASSA